MKVTPLVKWAGGKRQLLPHLLSYIPSQWNVYHEPFAGGLALLTALYNRGLITRAVISDLNEELINMYLVVKQRPYELIEAIKNIDKTNDKEIYLANRKRFNEIRGKIEHPVERAALFLYLNKYGFNGLWRVNKRGEFNVPFGKYKNPRVPTAAEILAFSNMLQVVDILNEDFEKAVKKVNPGDFVYFDPPYHPVSATAYFTDYTAEGFGIEDQKRLARVTKELANRGVYVMVSNSDTKLIWELYNGFRINPITANRSISSKAETRKNTGREVIITTYKPKEKKVVKLWDQAEEVHKQEKPLKT